MGGRGASEIFWALFYEKSALSCHIKCWPKFLEYVLIVQNICNLICEEENNIEHIVLKSTGIWCI